MFCSRSSGRSTAEGCWESIATSGRVSAPGHGGTGPTGPAPRNLANALQLQPPDGPNSRVRTLHRTKTLILMLHLRASDQVTIQDHHGPLHQLELPRRSPGSTMAPSFSAPGGRTKPPASLLRVLTLKYKIQTENKLAPFYLDGNATPKMRFNSRNSVISVQMLSLRVHLCSLAGKLCTSEGAEGGTAAS